MGQQILWCCHVRGPDELHAAKDYETARTMADDINFVFAPHKGVAKHEFDPIIIAAPMIWPYSAESHAENIRQLCHEYPGLDGYFGA